MSKKRSRPSQKATKTQRRRRQQARMSVRPRNSNGELYSPQRDLAYIFPYILERATAQIEADVWKEPLDMIQRMGGSKQDLVEAAQALIAWANAIADDPEEECKDVLERVGWFKVHPAARWFFQGVIGSITICAAYDSVLDVTFDGNLPEHITSILDSAAHYYSLFANA